MAAALIDARALWWHEADDCKHGDYDDCDCWSEAGWDFDWAGWYAGPWSAEVAGVRCITDARLMIREDLLTNWPAPGDPARPHLDELGKDRTDLLAEMLGSPEGPLDAARVFDPVLLAPLTGGGYVLQPLQHKSRVHAVVAPDGTRVGLLMPLREPVTS